jgi:hypothetical protein
MDSMRAIRHIRTLVRASRETDDADLMKKHLEEINQIIDKVLGPTASQTHFGHSQTLHQPQPPK